MKKQWKGEAGLPPLLFSIKPPRLAERFVENNPR